MAYKKTQDLYYKLELNNSLINALNDFSSQPT